jgi:hypothetical protein
MSSDLDFMQAHEALFFDDCGGTMTNDSFYSGEWRHKELAQGDCDLEKWSAYKYEQVGRFAAEIERLKAANYTLAQAVLLADRYSDFQSKLQTPAEEDIVKRAIELAKGA